MGGQKRDGHHEANTTKDSERIEGSKTGQGTQSLGGSELLDRRPKLTHLPDDACSCDKESKDIAGGRRLLSPPSTPETSTASRTGQGGGENQNIGALERTQGTQGSGPPDGNGGRRVILALLGGGGRHLNEKYGRIGGKRRRERCTRGQSGWRHGARAGEYRRW